MDLTEYRLSGMLRLSLVLAMGLTLTGCAARQLPPQTSLSGQTTMVGCLSTGTAPGEYVLTDSRGGSKTVVVGHPQLAVHADNHAVRIVGILGRESGGQGLKAIEIDHIAASCATPF